MRTDVDFEDIVMLGVAVAQIGAERSGPGHRHWRRSLSILLDGLRPDGRPVPAVER